MEDNEIIKIGNYRQACAYISDGVQPIKLYYNKNGHTMFFIFRKEDTKEVWEKWKRGEYKDTIFSDT